LSKHLAALERELGITLIQRSTSSASLTHAGKAFLAEAHKVIAANDAAIKNTREASRRKEHRISVGGIHHQGFIQMCTTLIDAYRRAGDHLDISFNGKAYPSTDAMLADDACDVFFVCEPCGQLRDGLERVALFYDRMAAVLPRDHALAASGGPVRFEDVANETLMVATGSVQFDNWPRIEELCRLKGVEPRTELRKMASSYEFLSAELFESVYFVPAFAVPFFPMLHASLFSCPVVADEDCLFEYSLLWRPNKNPFARTFVEGLLEQRLPEGLLSAR
jgi:DNA-binding transcriptional LysR family regulator